MKVFRLIESTRPRLVLLVLWSVTVGFLLASRGTISFFLLFETLAGTAFVAGGAMALNEWMERESDKQMKRTENRPLPSARLNPREVLRFGISISIVGIVALAVQANILTAILGGLASLSYLLFYTPLKTKTWLCTLAGAVPGAIPPVMGWAAARGTLDLGAWILFSILFAWQLPHFFAIAWIYREDYERAGLRMLSVVDPTGNQIGRQIMISSLGVHLLSLLPALTGMTGFTYYLAALLLGIWFLASSFQMAFRLESCSRSFFRKSVLYLTFLLLLMILDKNPV